MKGHHERRWIERHANCRLDKIPRRQRIDHKMVQRGRACDSHPPRLLPHRDHPISCLLRRHKVQMTQLGQRVTDLLVDRPFADLSTLDVRNRDTECHRSSSGRKHLETVGNQQQNVWTQFAKAFRKAQRRPSDALGHALIRVRRCQKWNFGGHFIPLAPHQVDGSSKALLQMRSAHQQRHPNVIPCTETTKHRLDVPPIRP